MEDNILYIGLFLNEIQKLELKMVFNAMCTDYPLRKYINLERNYKEYFDHVTLIFRTQFDDNKEKLEELLPCIGSLALQKIELDAIGYSDKCVALRVVKSKFINTYCANKNPHIMAIVYEGHKPVDSNEIVNWIDIPKITLFAQIDAVYKKKPK